MKKLLRISLIAILAVSPMMANAAVTDGEPAQGTAPGIVPANDVVAPFALRDAESNDGAVATGGYVKGAYNAAIKAINSVNANTVHTVTAGSANGTIAVDGRNVNVTGLGSAAYTNTDAYATAQQGAKADAVYDVIQAKDTTVTANSANLVTSGAVSTAIANAVSGINTNLDDYATINGVETTINSLTYTTTMQALNDWGSTNTIPVSATTNASEAIYEESISGGGAAAVNPPAENPAFPMP